jgi:hypothetical protein
MRTRQQVVVNYRKTLDGFRVCEIEVLHARRYTSDCRSFQKARCRSGPQRLPTHGGLIFGSFATPLILVGAIGPKRTGKAGAVGNIVPNVSDAIQALRLDG